MSSKRLTVRVAIMLLALVICLLMPVLADSRATYMPLPVTSQAGSSPRFLEMMQLGGWLKQGKQDAVRSWILSHREQALNLMLEASIDVRISGLLSLPPVHPHSAALLPVLERNLGLKCNDSSSGKQSLCASLAEEVELLSTLRDSVEEVRISRLPGIEQPTASSVIFQDGKEHGPWSELGRLYLWRMIEQFGGEAEQRRPWLEQALAVAKQWRASYYSALFYLGMAETASEPGERKNYQQMARTLIQQLRSPVLEAEYLLHEALLTRSAAQLARARDLIRSLSPPEVRDMMQLKLADAQLQSGQISQGHAVYHQLLSQGGKQAKISVIRRLLHLRKAADLKMLEGLYSRTSDPELRAELVYVYTALGKSKQLLALLKGEGQPLVRRAMVIALIGVMGKPEPGSILFDLPFLLQDPDPEIRLKIAYALLYSRTPSLEAQGLTLLDSQDPALQAVAAEAAGYLERRELKPKLLPLLISGHPKVRAKAIESVQTWVTPADVPALEALRAKATGQAADPVKLVLARLESPEAWLEELMQQAEGPAFYLTLWDELYRAVNTKFIRPAHLEPYLRHPQPKIAATVADVRKHFVAP